MSAALHAGAAYCHYCAAQGAARTGSAYESCTHINNVAAVAATTEVVETAAVQQSLPRQHRVHAITCDNPHHTSYAYCQQRVAHSKLKDARTRITISCAPPFLILILS